MAVLVAKEVAAFALP